MGKDASLAQSVVQAIRVAGGEVAGQLFKVGGGCIARLRWERYLAAEWATLQEFPGDDHPSTVSDCVAPIARNAGIKFN